MTDFEKRLEAYINPLEQALLGFLPDIGASHGSMESPGETDAVGSEECKPSAVKAGARLGCDGSQLSEAMAYSLLSGGKRIRAVLLLATCEMLGGDFHAAIPFAAAIEMVHAYSLIHDDLPCMDDDDMRRGKPSCHVKFGEATALLAGDGLLTLAFETLLLKQNTDVFGAEKTLASIRSLSGAAGANGMVGGQMIDLENENRVMTLDALMLINSKKTGALIKSACEVGCILGGADEKVTAHVLEYAAKIGLAFQIVDDILDVTADEKQLGKRVGSDVQNHKTTYASLYGVDEAKRIAAELTREAVGEINRTGLDAAFLCELARTLADRTH